PIASAPDAFVPDDAAAPGGQIVGAAKPADPLPAAATALTAAFDPGDPMIIIPTAMGEQAHILKGTEVAVGRSDDNAIVIRDTFRWGRRARILHKGNGWVGMDRDEVTRPTHINGTLVSGPHPLADGDEIQIGETKLRFSWGSGAPIDLGATQAASLPHQGLAG